MQQRSRTQKRARLVPLMVGLAIGTIACAQKMNVGLDDDAPANAPAFVPQGEDGGDSSSAALCVGTTCPWPYADCPGANGELTYHCGINLLSDNANCGACGNVCPDDVGSERQMATRCLGGKCQVVCQDNFSIPGQQDHDPKNCNGRVDDGCETDVLSDPDNCGSCGNVCGNFPDGTRQPCIGHRCGCPQDTTYCPGIGCVDLKSDLANCGACGTQCTPPDSPPPDSSHLDFVCRAGACTYACGANWDDCDKNPANGCETGLLDRTNCGACGVACTEEQRCVADSFDSPARCICGPNEVECGGRCTTLLSDPSNCGACGHACPGNADEHSQPACTKGYCTVECVAGFGDCDGNPLNGCEADLRRDGTNCGSCANACDVAGGQPCIEGRCLNVECDAGAATK